MKALKYRLANANDVETLVALINQAYRINTGRSWTNEQHIVIGDRINAQQLKQTLAQENFCIFIAEMVEDLESVLVACIGLTLNEIFKYKYLKIILIFIEITVLNK